jgi:hypothetical protein
VARVRALIDRVRARRKNIDTELFGMGKDLRALSKPLLYRAAGYRSFEELLIDRELPTRMQAWKLISIADSFDEPTATAKGVAWCYAVLRYAAEKTGGDVRRLLRKNPLLPGSRLRIRDARATHIDAALRHQGPGFSPELRRATQHEASRLARSFRRKGARGAKARTVAGEAGWIIRLELTAEASRRYLS